MARDIDAFKAMFPEYSGFSNTDQFAALRTIAETRVQGPDWDAVNADYAVLLLVAHMIKVYEDGRHAKISEKDSGLAADYHIPSTFKGDEGLNQTVYGSQYVELRDSMIFVPPVV